ncbi:MBL fold metallo-hydrolase [uncultured Paraglaciecola sp.]|uniref:MBL fold metallo-hydrolase n=1 Tax=uncultured Paraglaciecola sp. TaxID=1765024 RepID=UPI002612F831|nr:MBL fold metallo-hydrolase [uncultured Paraglaciecola sp.]
MNRLIFLLCLIACSHSKVFAHQASATYVANEAVLIVNGNQKVLFDPFFHRDFGTYQLVPKETRQAIFDARPPFDNLDAIVISHAHDDHFSAEDVLKYLLKHSKTKLVAPQQAVNAIRLLNGAKAIESQLVSVNLVFDQPPQTLKVADLLIEAVRIPHAGWPARAEVENIVFRVTLKEQDNQVTVMHLGDADPDDEHYIKYKDHWHKRISNTAFPPYWFYLSAEGNDILSDILNVKQSVGIHVPTQVPNSLKSSGKDYFSRPGEKRIIKNSHEH